MGDAMKLTKLHEQFIEKAQRPMRFGALPVAPLPAEAPILVVDRWQEVAGALHKVYTFRRIEDRDAFVVNLLSYERATQHHATLTVDHDTVTLKLQTKDVDRVTNLDREYAKYADASFRELVYRSNHGDEG
jgi:pterin-4a-carbinolamine dehydratase